MKSPKLKKSLLATELKIVFGSMKYFQEIKYPYFNFLLVFKSKCNWYLTNNC